ncbi:MAG TPA: alcohol dehydrogenase catalytic domain-containing protein, partial [Chloroflexota bacterium]|nr:alcohol dehydrogenase catalytic domain-containing protein [Chloroflexota bacterium]
MNDGQMTAVRFHGPGQHLQLETVPIPSPALGEALIRVRAAGVCHTELHLLDGVLNLGVSPLTPGHEVVGDVVETRGPSHVAIGQRVLLYYFIPCGSCSYCRAGLENLCPNFARQIGFSADGGYADYLVAPVRCLVPVPASLGDDEAVGLACGGATALHAARSIARVGPGETVVVYGIGGVGLYLIQVCSLAGARVVAIGRSEEKLRLAAEVGADRCVNTSVDDP